MLATVALLVLVGGAAVLYLLDQERRRPSPRRVSPRPRRGPTRRSHGGRDGRRAEHTRPPSRRRPRFVKAGQCVRNQGPAGGKPKLLISECAPKTYEVLRRIDGATSGEKDAATKCAKVDGYTNWYFFDSELDTLDFVLCLKQR